MFQSPSLRGSGRFAWTTDEDLLVGVEFQSPSLRGSGRFVRIGCGGASAAPVSIPFIAGQWSLPRRMAGGGGAYRSVSIPFIAGQWSLPGAEAEERARKEARFNPLHCGAVVASLHAPLAARRGGGRFNPLHCGAVVASRGRAPRWKRVKPFQSPSLRGSGRFPATFCRGGGPRPFQSPSLRGSGRFNPARHPHRGGRRGFNPLHCGAVVASRRRYRRRRCRSRVSIPFIAGQWSLRPPMRRSATSFFRFQSPSLRGSGRFPPRRRAGGKGETCFNPLHCGAVVASGPRRGPRRRCEVSIPFIAGQWSLRRRSPPRRRTRRYVSIPFIAGQWSLQRARAPKRGRSARSQSPSLRGSGRFSNLLHQEPLGDSCLNPLHCGAVVASDSGTP